MSDPAEVLYEGKFLRFMRRGNWEYAERKDCTGVVFIVALTTDRKIVLCEQFRVPIGKTIIEIPAGLVEDKAEFANESLEMAARRELHEETGYEAETMELLFQGPAAPGSSSAIIHFYIAGNIRKTGPGGGDDTENIVVHEVPLENADTWLQQMEADGRLIDPKVFSGLHLLQSRVFNPRQS